MFRVEPLGVKELSPLRWTLQPDPWGPGRTRRTTPGHSRSTETLHCRERIVRGWCPVYGWRNEENWECCWAPLSGVGGEASARGLVCLSIS